jgi:type I restriction enzyme M protein
LSWEITDDTLAVLAANKKLAKLDDDIRTKFIDAVIGWQVTAWKPDGSDLRKRITGQLKDLGAHSRVIEDAVMDALAVRDPDAPAQLDKNGNLLADPDLRDNENVPLPKVRLTFETDATERLNSPAYREAIDTYVQAEVKPHVPDAWVDFDKTKVGYEIPLTKHFYVYAPLRPLAEINAEIQALEDEIQALLFKVTE